MTQPLNPATLPTHLAARAALEVLAQMFEYYDYQAPVPAADLRQAA